MYNLGSIPGLGRSPGERNGYPLQYSDLENSVDRGAWQATVYGVSKGWTRLNDFHFPLGLTGLISLQFKGLSGLLQHHSSKASILQHSAFFMVQLSHPVLTEKTKALTILPFVGKVMFLEVHVFYCICFLLMDTWVCSVRPLWVKLLDPLTCVWWMCFRLSWACAQERNCCRVAAAAQQIFSVVETLARVWELCLLRILTSTWYCQAFTVQIFKLFRDR